MPVGRRFETGTLPYELLAGFSATIGYLDSLGGIACDSRLRARPRRRLIAGLPQNVTLYGPPAMDGRVPTFLFNVDGVAGRGRRARAAERGIGVWHADNWYCVSLGPHLPEQSLRAGIAHYNTAPRSTGCSQRSLRSEPASRG